VLALERLAEVVELLLEVVRDVLEVLVVGHRLASFRGGVADIVQTCSTT
jgi:hypothetical protein